MYAILRGEEGNATQRAFTTLRERVLARDVGEHADEGFAVLRPRRARAADYRERESVERATHISRR